VRYSLRYSYAPNLAVIGLIAITTTAGCGTVNPGRAALRPLFKAECDAALTSHPNDINYVVLDWTGGVSPIYPDDRFDGVDLTRFTTADGFTLADDAEAFQEDVRLQVAHIYCDSSPHIVMVLNGEADRFGAEVNMVHITQALPPKGGTDVGEGEYDPCNRQHDNAALLFGERLLSLADDYTYDEWVNVFANIIAHEVGHTLGFGHLERAERNNVGRSVYVELMLSGHTMSELRQEQRFVADMTNCPQPDATSARTVKAANVCCSAARLHGD